MTTIGRGYTTVLDSAFRPVPSNRFVEKLARRLGQLWCGLRGHDQVLEYGVSRVFLRCTSCDHETPGWRVDVRRYQVTQPGDIRRQRARLLRTADRRVA